VFQAFIFKHHSFGGIALQALGEIFWGVWGYATSGVGAKPLVRNLWRASPNLSVLYENFVAGDFG